MQQSTKILDSQILCALGENSRALQHLRDGTTELSSKEIDSDLLQIRYPYYSIEPKEHNFGLSVSLEYIFDVVGKLLSRSDLSADEHKNMAIFFGCASIDLSVAEVLQYSLDESFESTLCSKRIGSGYYAEAIASKFGIDGLCFTYNTACTSSANALLDADLMLKSGAIQHALIVGFESYAPTTVEGFSVMGLLSQNCCSPFDINRDGIVLGEAVSAAILSSNGSSDWTLCGGKSSCETHSITGTSADGIEIAKVMQGALENSSLRAEQITLIKAHATASALNDTAEINAMRSLFGNTTPFISLKPYIGHTLGGCALAELVLMMLAVDDGFVPKSLNFIEGESSDMSPLCEIASVDGGVFMMNYFGFGGNNTSFIVSKSRA